MAQGQRWTATWQREVVLRLLPGEPMELLSREVGVELLRLEKVRGRRPGGPGGGPQGRGDSLQGGLDHALRRPGEMTMENEWWGARARLP